MKLTAWVVDGGVALACVVCPHLSFVKVAGSVYISSRNRALAGVVRPHLAGKLVNSSRFVFQGADKEAWLV